MRFCKASLETLIKEYLSIAQVCVAGIEVENCYMDAQHPL